jgi:hypothetical protein
VSHTSLILIFVAWAAANLVAYGLVIFSERPALVRSARTFCKLSQRAVVAVITVLIAEVFWQEFLLNFSASPTLALTVPVQDHGTKYVSPRDADIIRLFGTIFYLTFLPMFALFIGEAGVRSVSDEAETGKSG